MKKKILSLLAVFALILSFAVSASAESLPDWYPDDISGFVRFHNDTAPRVVDNADIFYDWQEDEMLDWIAGIRDNLGFDLVIYTDDTDYGLGRGLCAADFHFYGGYGFGDDYTGTVLFICMEPGNRGWFTATSGECIGIYTDDVLNGIDDKLEPYMVAGAQNGNENGEYGEGVIDYLGNVYELYENHNFKKNFDTMSVGDKLSGLDIGNMFILSLIAGIVSGVIVLVTRLSGMKSIRKAQNADRYSVRDSFRRVALSERLVDVHVTRTAKPKNESSSSSSSSSGGSFHSSGGSSHSSGGGSYGGGGRSF